MLLRHSNSLLLKADFVLQLLIIKNYINLILNTNI
jgi:hypothetical protein